MIDLIIGNFLLWKEVECEKPVGITGGGFEGNYLARHK